jgi:hypothetical protein
VPEALIARMRASALRPPRDRHRNARHAPAPGVRIFSGGTGKNCTSSSTASSACTVATRSRDGRTLAAGGAWREFVQRLLVEHYDPAYRRSSHKNFARLPDAQALRIASAEPRAFLDAARSLIEEAVSA